MLLLGFIFAISTAAQANENLSCFGIPALLGTGASVMYDRENGKLKLSRAMGQNPMLSLNDKGNTQTVRQRTGSVPLPGADGMLRNTDVEGLTSFSYANGRLSSGSFQMTEAGSPDKVISGNFFTYDWVNGACRPVRITMKNRILLGEKTGVLFDGEICKFLKDKGVFDPSKVDACMKNAAGIYQKLQEYDGELRKRTDEKELLVTGNAFNPSAISPIKNMNDSSFVMSYMSACVDYFKLGQTTPSGAARIDEEKPGSTTVR